MRSKDFLKRSTNEIAHINKRQFDLVAGNKLRKKIMEEGLDLVVDYPEIGQEISVVQDAAFLTAMLDSQSKLCSTSEWVNTSSAEDVSEVCMMFLSTLCNPKDVTDFLDEIPQLVILRDYEFYVNAAANFVMLKHKIGNYKRILTRIVDVLAYSAADFGESLITGFVKLQPNVRSQVIMSMNMACIGMMRSDIMLRGSGLDRQVQSGLDRVKAQVGEEAYELYFNYKKGIITAAEYLSELSLEAETPYSDVWPEIFNTFMCRSVPKLAEYAVTVEKVKAESEAAVETSQLKLREIKKLLKEYQTATATANKEKTVLENKLSNLEKQGVSDVSKYVKQIAFLENERDELQKRSMETKRLLSKRDKELDEAISRAKTLEIENSKIREEVTTLKTNPTEIPDMPVEALVNAIKDKKIMLVGGDSLFSRIHEYGLDGIRTISVDGNLPPKQAFESADLIVISTALNSHKMTRPPVSHARELGIKLIWFNGRNTDNFIREAFMAIYGG